LNDKVVYLISCSKLKENYPTKARDMYKSHLFKKSVQFVENVCFGQWRILSAKYGLVSPDLEIAPYDETLNGIGKAGISAWADGVFDQIIREDFDKVVFLSGKNYYSELRMRLIKAGIAVDVLMEGMGIGERLRFLTTELNKESL